MINKRTLRWLAPVLVALALPASPVTCQCKRPPGNKDDMLAPCPNLVLLDDRSRAYGVEVKYSLAPAVSRGFWHALQDIPCRRGFVVYPGEESYPLGKDVITVPISNLPRIWERSARQTPVS